MLTFENFRLDNTALDDRGRGGSHLLFETFDTGSGGMGSGCHELIFFWALNSGCTTLGSLRPQGLEED
jgi:hypothetical protein